MPRSMTIWKYPLEVSDEQEIEIPRGYRFLSVAMQRNEVCLWVAVDPEEKEVKVTIRVIGTGHSIPDYNELNYLGTFLCQSDSLVFHVFEKVPE